LVGREVKRLVDKDSELKYYSSLAFGSGVQCGSAMSTTNNQFFPVVPNLSQGVASYQHVGDAVTIRRLRWHGILQVFNPTATQLTSVGVRLLVVSSKSFPESTNATFPYIDLLKSSGANNAFTGAVANLYQDINRDEFEVLHDEVYPLSMFLNRTATTSYADKTDFESSFDIDIKYPSGRFCRYGPGTSVPYTFNPILLVGYSHLDATGTIDAVAAGLVSIIGNISMWYTDA
jgi:hypothetical protein